MTRPARVIALTFDFWNTLYSADGGSWSAVRTARMQALGDMLATTGLHPPEEELDRVYQAGFDVYMQAWTSGRHFGAREEVEFFLEQFGLDVASLENGAAAQAVLEIENAARQGVLPLLSGVAETIPRLSAEGYQLGLISDTSLTPGRVLREFLAEDGLLEHFAALTFSDETGYPKPDRRMFEKTLTELGVEPGRAVHVGDTPRTDIAGAKAVGMVTIRCAGASDNEDLPEADFVIRDHREIPAILERLG